MNAWHKTDSNRWECFGMYIAKYWTTIGPKTNMFMVFEDKEAFYAGNNLTTKDTLKEAKAFASQWLSDELDRDIKAMEAE